MTDLYEVMRCAPSTRYFTDEPVPKETLHRVLDNARFAPSGGNRQGWRVIVVTDRDTRRQLRELYEPAWVEYTKQMGVRAMLDASEPPEGVPAGRWRMLKGADEFAHTFDEVPVHLVPCVDIDALAIVDEALERPSIVGGASVYPFVQNVLLGLRAEGLGRRVHDAARAGRAAGAGAPEHPWRDRRRRAHLGRPPGGPVARQALP